MQWPELILTRSANIWLLGQIEIHPNGALPESVSLIIAFLYNLFHFKLSQRCSKITAVFLSCGKECVSLVSLACGITHSEGMRRPVSVLVLYTLYLSL